MIDTAFLAGEAGRKDPVDQANGIMASDLLKVVDRGKVASKGEVEKARRERRE